MLKPILDLLNGDNYLSSTLTAITGAYGREIPFVRYNYAPLTNDGIKAQARLELTAVANNIGQSLEIIDKINKVLLTIGDAELTSDIKVVSQNGGGQLFNEDTGTWHTKAIYTILYKERG